MDYKIEGFLINTLQSQKNEEKINIILSNVCQLQDSNVTCILNPLNKINNIIEKYIYDIAEFHIKRLNKNPENTYIEFWFKNNNNPDNSLHFDCDEYDRQINKSEDYNIPFLSCVTYLNDCNIPTIITNIDKEKYKYKDFSDDILVAFSLPRKSKQVTFEGGKYYHGAYKITQDQDYQERKILIINLWDKKPLNVPYFNYGDLFYKYAMNIKEELKDIDFDKNKKILKIIENNKIKTQNTKYITDDFLNKIIYEGMEIELFENFQNILNDTNNDIFIFKKEIIKNSQKPSSEYIQTQQIPNEFFDIDQPKFNQRFIFKNHFTKDICKWIINESEEYASQNNGWMTDRHNKYPTTDLPVEKIPNIFRYILTSFHETISKYIIESYCLQENEIILEIKDLFIVKYEHDKQNFLEFHTDGSLLTVNILLSEKSEFKGGGTLFEDDITYYLNQGDMILHSSKSRHSGLPITEGKRYLLVFFINLYKK